MNDESLKEILSVELKDLSEESFEFLREKLNVLSGQGYTGLKIVVLGNPLEASGFEKDRAELFNKIKEKQGLPDNVVIDFMNAGGRLAGTDFGKRLK